MIKSSRVPQNLLRTVVVLISILVVLIKRTAIMLFGIRANRVDRKTLTLLLVSLPTAYLATSVLFPASMTLPPKQSFMATQRPAVAQLLSPPTTTVTLRPTAAHVDTTLHGSATFMDPDGNLEGASAYRWLINGSPVISGTVPQSLLLPLDNSLRGTDGQPPTQSQGLSFVTGRFGQAVEFSRTANSRLAYPSAGNVDPNEGSIEMWVRLTHDLTDTVYTSYPRLFSYEIDDEHQLYMEVNRDRISITSRNEGSYYGAWPALPGWRAGEWHHLAATWSASANQLAIYYDCMLATTGYDRFPALAGTANTFNLGSGSNWGVMDAALDDVRVSRRALTASEIGAMCSRGGPAPNDEVTLLPGRTATGDVVTFELTPCDDTGTCGVASSASVTITATPQPTATVALRPTAAYVDMALRGSATFTGPGGNLEGASVYRWLINSASIISGIVPQSLLLPLDGSFRSTDGQLPTQSWGLSFVTGRFGQAVEFSRTANSRLAYPSAGNVGPNEGSIEMWVRLTHDLTDTVYTSYPRLFSYEIDDEHQLYIEVNDGRISITSRNEGSYYGAWPALPGWRAGEWHHLAATWSASANQLALYYDCVLVATDYNHFPALAGTASTFNLGSGNKWGVMDATLDDVRVSRRALTANEIGAMCSRGYPAPNDEVTLSPGRTAIGDVVTFELTPCDDTGICGAASSASVTIAATPLGNLQPAPGLLPSGSISFTLNLTTTAPANCRWSEIADTRYVSMTHDFQEGQGATLHSTTVNGLYNLNDRWCYVRCQDTSTGRDPDDYERQTHLRVLGPWNGNYPRIANLWGSYRSTLGVNFFAGYDLFVVSGWGVANQASAIRTVNHNAKILLTLNATYGGPQDDPLTAEWWNSSPADPGYNCLLRDTVGNILLVPYYEHPMYNMTVPYCRMVLVQQSVDTYLSAQPKKGNNLAYDGIYWDRLHESISWLLGDDIDSDLDGQPDDPEVLDAAYQAGVEDFLAQARAHLPNAILMGNGALQIYAPWLNGSLYEWELAGILDGIEWLSWDELVWNYRDWTRRGHTPYTTFIESAPESLYSEKYTFRHLDQMPPAMEAEVAASYERMRYGLTSALMGDGLFSYDYGPDWHGNPWWYDEFGALDGSQATRLPPRGYLGQPTGDPFLLMDTLDTPDQVVNGDFEDGLNNWSWWVASNDGAAATFGVDVTGGISDTAAAHIVVTSAGSTGSVEFRQFEMGTAAGQSYTLSFWARSSVTQTIRSDIIKQTEPWTNHGFGVKAVVTPQWQHFHLSDNASVTAGDGKLEFLVGDVVGELWLDNVQFQEGALGVWARPFHGGLAVINTTKEVQTVPLPHVYRKLDGSQAPLFQIRMDDDEARVSGSWSRQPANFSQFGNTVHVITSPNPLSTVTYSPTLAYSGTYHVLAWVVPSTTQSSAVSVTIHHSNGETVVLLDETQGEIGWRDLGVYTFDVTGDNRAVLAATGNGTVVADAFKWVSTARYNDGNRVAQITLQPREGIILVNAFRVFLPIVIKR